MKKMLCAVLAMILFLSALLPAAKAADLYLIDNAGLLSEEEKASVERSLSEASETIGMDVLVYTTDSLSGKSLTAYADDAMDYEFGQVDSGIMFLISMEDRDFYVSTKEQGVVEFSEGEIDYIVNDFLPDLSAGNYAEAFIAFAENVVSVYQDPSQVPDSYDYGQHSQIDVDRSKGGFHFSFTGLVVSFVFALIVALVVVGGMKRQLKSAVFHNANSYLVPGSLHLVQNTDLFLYSNVTRTRIESSSSSGGGGGVHTSSSGSSHGGHGGKF
ncbi:MAG: TPM domain-containing protein [Clostridia bacterium]|nr:TPM domain-containing protein [Clostridia bacterium]